MRQNKAINILSVRRFGIIALIPVLALLSCSQPDENPPAYTPPETDNEFVKKVSFSGPTATVNFSNLNNNDIFLVKVNTSDSVVSAANTGRVQALPISLQNNDGLPDTSEKKLPRMGHPAADEFNANPLPIVHEPPRRLQEAFIPPVPGNKRTFWVESYFNSETWVQKQATLRATGQYGNIWIMDENYSVTPGTGNKITAVQALALAGKFDKIYPAATNILGYEYGGGPNGDGGRDEDPKIQILVYDIVDASGTVQAAGYFWAKDFYPQTQLDSWAINQKTNLAEIFYIDASHVNSYPNYIYSTLIHEFQHMIHFNEKAVKRGVNNSAAWYNEMLSKMTEDVIAPLIDISPAGWDHPIGIEIPGFLGSYNQVGITEWNTSSFENSRASYAKGFAFGAYLMRNYGGADILKKILANNTTNIESITAALNEFSPGLTFEQALARFGEAMIFSGSKKPDGVMSFDKTVTSTINSRTYTAYGFNIWSMSRTGGGGLGPYIFSLNPANMRAHSVSLHSINGWKKRSGDFSITLEKPADAKIELYLMVK